MSRRLPALLCIAACHATAAAPQAPAAPAAAEKPAAEELGSTRNQKVALPRTGAPTPLVYFAHELDEARRKELERVAPHVRLVTGLSREQALARAAEANAADAVFATPDFVRAATHLVWIQAGSAGVDHLLAEK